jgi:hypothetical protein
MSDKDRETSEKQFAFLDACNFGRKRRSSKNTRPQARFWNDAFFKVSKRKRGDFEAFSN